MTSVFSGICTFGDVFEFEGTTYIFLAPSEDGVYCAKVLSKEISTFLDQDCLSRTRKNKETDQWKFCYVILTTEELEQRAAHFGQPVFNYNRIINKLAITLNHNDLIDLQKAILTPSKVTLKGLVEAVSKVEISKK